MTAVRIPTEFTRAATCRIVTRGRVSGATHAVTVWFAPAGTAIYVAVRNGLRSDWLRNALSQSRVEVSWRNRCWPARATLVTDPDEARVAVQAFAEKYAKHQAIISAWRQAPPVLVRLELSR